MSRRLNLCAAVAMSAATLTACGNDAPQVASPKPSSPPVSSPSSGHGTLTNAEYSVALKVAKHEQARVTGTFVGATAVAHSDDFKGGECPSGRNLHIRLVWQDDANFEHGGTVMGGQPDGPRKALILFADPQSGVVCRTGARYRDVGASATETLLYGEWPDPKDS